MNARCRVSRTGIGNGTLTSPTAIAMARPGVRRLHLAVIAGALLALTCVQAFSAYGEPGQVTATAPDARSLALTFSPAPLLQKNAASTLPQSMGARFEVGKPDLPIYGQWVLIPNGTGLSLHLTPGAPRVVEDVDMPPVQPPQADSYTVGPEPYRQDALTYATDADYPGVLAEADAPTTVRGQDCTVVWLYPYQYNPIQRQLTIYEDLTVDVVFDGAIQTVPVNLRNDTFAAMWRRLAVNADTVLAAQEEAAVPIVRSVFAPDGDGSTGGCDYLIVTPPDFETEANTLAAWKRLSGFRTKVVTTTTTGATAAEIETYIDGSQAWSPAPSYILLFGDAEYIPTFYVLTHASDAGTPASGGLMQGKVASDRYYADTNGDIYSDLFIGRLPVNTIVQAEDAVNRIISYERTPPDPATYASFYTTAAICAYFQDNNTDGYADRRFAKTSEDIHQFLTLSAGFTAERIYYTPGGVTPTNWNNDGYYNFENDTGGAALPAYLQKPSFAWDGARADISSAVEAGTFLLTHRDHGSRRMYSVPTGYYFAGGWADPEFTPFDAMALANGTLTPVVWSLNCQTGWFDNETDDATYEYYQSGSVLTHFEARETDECFCEELIVNPGGGAVGVIGATRVSYSGINDRLAWGWMDALWPGFIEYHSGTYGDSTALYQMGPVFEYGKNYMLTKYALDNYVRTAIDEYIWFGDPTMEMRTGVPQSLNVTHPATVTVNEAADVDVAVTRGGSALPGARVTISRAATPADYWTDTTNASGLVTFSALTASVEGDYDIVVAAHDSLPYEGTLTSEAVVKTITVTAPNGGESWARRTSQAVTWSSENVTGNVTIDLYKGGALSRTLTSAAAASAGTWAWAVPDTETIAADYQIRVTSADDGTVFDASDATFSITANAAPTANGDAYAVDEGATLSVAAAGVLSNDTDPEDDALSATVNTGPAHGNLTLNSDGSFSYTHDGSETTTDSFAYVANDGTSDSNPATVTITINPRNDAPVANGDSYALAEGGTLNSAAPGVLSNDTDAEDDALTAILFTGPAHGTLTLNSDGSFSYIHDGGETASDGFTYMTSDGTAQSNMATVSITINPLNDAPTANGDAYAVDEADTLNVAANGVLANDTDSEGESLTSILATAPAHGALTLNADGSFTYVHNGSETTSDSFTYRAHDGTTAGAPATVALTINPVDDPLEDLTLSSTTIDEGQPAGSTVGTLTGVDPDGGPPCTFTLVDGQGSDDNGSFLIDSSASLVTNECFLYEVKSSYNIRVCAEDGHGGLVERALLITVADVSTDVDGDGVSDAEEAAAGTDPFDTLNPTPILSVAQQIVDAAIQGGISTVSVVNQGLGVLVWEAEVTAGGDWLSLGGSKNGMGSGTLSLVYGKNEAQSLRTATVRVTSTNAVRGPIDVTVRQAACTILPPPGNVQATDGTHEPLVVVSWDAVPGASYEVFRGTESNFGAAQSLGGTSLTYFEDATAAPPVAGSGCGGGVRNSVYYYWVVAFDVCGPSQPSAPDTGYRGLATSKGGAYGDVPPAQAAGVLQGDPAVFGLLVSAFVLTRRKARRK